MERFQRLSVVLGITFLILACANFVFGKEPDWFRKLKQIKPLFSTESEVEKFFGKPIKSYSNVREYETKDGLLKVTYSTGYCLEQKSFLLGESYNVRKGIVIDFYFSINQKVRFKSLKLNLSNFQVERESDNPTIHYKNFNLGLIYSTVDGFLGTIYVLPADKYSFLECPKK